MMTVVGPTAEVMTPTTKDISAIRPAAKLMTNAQRVRGSHAAGASH